MLRLVIWVLLVANAGYFAWTQGYLAAVGLAPADQAEPERLKAQIRPDALRLLNGARPAKPAAPPQAPIAAPAATPEAATSEPLPAATTEPATATASAALAAASVPVQAVAPATVCWQASGFTQAQGESLRAALALLDLPRGSWQLNETQSGGRWVVYMGRYNEEQLARKKTELSGLGVEFRELSVPALSPGLALGTYSSEAAAQTALQDVVRKGVRSARVAQERSEATSVSLRLPAATDAQRAAVAGLGSPLAGKTLQRCN